MKRKPSLQSMVLLAVLVSMCLAACDKKGDLDSIIHLGCDHNGTYITNSIVSIEDGHIVATEGTKIVFDDSFRSKKGAEFRIGDDVLVISDGENAIYNGKPVIKVEVTVFKYDGITTIYLEPVKGWWRSTISYLFP